MTQTFKQHTRKVINEAVALVNAPRRSAAYDVNVAWSAVLAASGPQNILKNGPLHNISREIRREIERCTLTAPKFSADSTIALFEISSAAQVHPIIAIRWSGHLRSEKLEMVMCASHGHLPGKVSFSCRIAKSAQARQGIEKVDIIEKLEAIVRADRALRERLGENFARGHKEASGGIIAEAEWIEFKTSMRISEKEKQEQKTKPKKDGQKNTFTRYFNKA